MLNNTKEKLRWLLLQVNLEQSLLLQTWLVGVRILNLPKNQKQLVVLP